MGHGDLAYQSAERNVPGKGAGEDQKERYRNPYDRDANERLQTAT